MKLEASNDRSPRWSVLSCSHKQEKTDTEIATLNVEAQSEFMYEIKLKGSIIRQRNAIYTYYPYLWSAEILLQILKVK